MIKAYVNHNRWIAECPHCKWAIQVVNETEMTCGNCHATDSIQYPNDRDAIDEVLSLRPNEENRNWYPYETLADLRIENAAHSKEIVDGMDSA